MDALTHTAFAAKRVAVPHTGGVSGGDVLKYQNGFNFFTDFGKKTNRRRNETILRAALKFHFDCALRLFPDRSDRIKFGVSYNMQSTVGVSNAL